MQKKEKNTENQKMTHQVNLTLDSNAVIELENFAKKMKITRAQLIRNLLDEGLNDLKLMNSTGLLTMAVKGFDVISLVKKALNEKRFVFEEKKLIIDL